MGKKHKRKDFSGLHREAALRQARLAHPRTVNNSGSSVSGDADLIEDWKQELGNLVAAYGQLVTNSFKLRQAIEDLADRSERGADRARSRLAFFIEDLNRLSDRAGVRITDLSGYAYEPGLEVEVVNLDEFEPDVALVIEEMLEPLLSYEPKNEELKRQQLGGRIRTGKATVKPKEN